MGRHGSPVGGVEGTARTYGIVDTGSDPVVKRAVILWGLALAALMFFHVGGSKL
jgi:hypothetical protein